VRVSFGVNEVEIREFFGEHAAGITRVNYPPTHAGKAQKIAYVEFGDEEAMKAALAGHAETLHGVVPEVKQAADRDSNAFRGRGGSGGKSRFFSRNLAAAGLAKLSGGGGNDLQGS